MTELTVEYLITVSKKMAFCRDGEAFNRLLQVDPDIHLQKGQILFKKSIAFSYGITSGEVIGKDQLYLHLKFTRRLTSDVCQPELEGFSEFLKTIRGIAEKTGGSVTSLWDDISFSLAHRAYPIIHEIESLMRKLITNFMLVKLGEGWASEAVPEAIKTTIVRNPRKNSLNALHAIDFIGLADLLLKPYATKETDKILADVARATDITDLENIKEYLPRSNWQRYFARLVECEDGQLLKWWKELGSCVISARQR